MGQCGWEGEGTFVKQKKVLGLEYLCLLQGKLESHSHTMIGAGRDLQMLTPSPKQDYLGHNSAFHQVLKVSREGESTISLDSLV